MTRNPQQGAQQYGSQFGPMRDQLAYQRVPGFSIFAECANRIVQVALEDDGGAIIERMGDRSWRLNPLEPILVKRQRRKEWGCCGHWMHGRAEVVAKSGKREFQG